MRLLITSSLSRGLASLAIPRLLEIPGVEIALVLLDEGGSSRPRWGRKLRKILRIGPLGALNGVRMRRWYLEDVQALLRLDSLEAVCHGHGLRLERPPGGRNGPGKPGTDHRQVRPHSGANQARLLGDRRSDLPAGDGPRRIDRHPADDRAAAGDHGGGAAVAGRGGLMRTGARSTRPQGLF